MKPAIAIKSCHTYDNRRKVQLDTWLRNVDADFFFVLGNTSACDMPSLTDALVCDVSDDYKDLAPKVFNACEYALTENVTNLLVCDDDTYIHWPRMLVSGFEELDYLGFVRNYGPVPYMQGSCFWLNERAMHAIVSSSSMLPGVPDDVAVGRCLYGKVPFTHEHRYQVGGPYPEPEQWPSKTNNIIASHKMNFMMMHACYDSLK